MRRAIKWTGLAAALVFAAALTALGSLGVLGDQFREVSPGKCYRSAQPSPSRLAELIRRHKIRCVVNLRGPGEDKAWYHEELRVCREAGVDHVDIQLTTKHIPLPESAVELVRRSEAGPFPMLLHCRDGADRSGLASAIYLAVAEKLPVEQAVDSHLAWRPAMHRFFELYRRTARDRDLRTWILRAYRRVYAIEMTGRDPDAEFLPGVPP
jgi:protein tyrosine/serine phosphatase